MADGTVEVKITGSVDGSLGASAKTAQAQINSLGSATQQASSQMAGVAKNAAATAASVSNAGHASGTAAREFRALFDELSSGRFYQTPSTIAILAQRVFGVGTAALITGGAIIALGYAVGLIAERAISAEAALRSLSLSGLGTKGFSASTEEIKFFTDQLKILPGESTKTAQSVVSILQGMENRTNETFVGLTSAVDQWATITGQKADKAAEGLSKVFGDPFSTASRNFLLNLEGVKSAEIDAYDQAVRSGSVYAAQAILLKSLNSTLSDSREQYIQHSSAIFGSAHNFISYITALGTGQSPQRAQEALVGEAAKRWDDLAFNIKNAANQLNSLKDGGDGDLKRALIDADAVDTTRVRVDRLTGDIKEFQTALANPNATEQMKKNLQGAIEAAQKEITSLTTKQTFAGSGFSNVGDQLIAQARETISEINATEGLGNAERLQNIRNTWAQVLASDRLNAAQRLEVEREKNSELAQAQRQQQRDAQAIARDTAQTDLEIARANIEAKKAVLEDEVAAGRISKQQELSDLIKFTQEEAQLQINAENTAERSYDKDSVAFAQAENRKRLIAAQSDAEIQRINTEFANASGTAWGRSLAAVQSAEGRLVQGIFSGTQTAKQILFSVVDEFAEKEIESGLKTLTQHLFVEAQKTAATQAGILTRIQLTLTGDAQGAAADAASGSVQIGNAALKAAAGAYSAVVGIPVVGPVLAPVAAGIALTAVEAFNTLKSLDVGAYNMPADMPAMLHKGEMVVPESFARGLRSNIEGGASPFEKSGGGGTVVHNHYNTINALDAASFQNLVKRDRHAITQIVSDTQSRNPRLRPSY